MTPGTIPGTILTTVTLVDGWVIIRLVNPPPRWKLRGRYVTVSDPPAYGEWFDGPSGTGDLVRVRQNEQSSSGMEWQVIAEPDPSEPAPVEPTPDEQPE